MSPKGENSRVAIILVNWNGWRDSIECLSSLFASNITLHSDVYLVDNASTDGSVEKIVNWCTDVERQAKYPKFDGVAHIDASPVQVRVCNATCDVVPQTGVNTPLTIINSGGNLGFAGGNNVGITAAGLANYSHFWLLNTDTVVRHDSLSQMLNRCSISADIGMVGSTLVYYHTPSIIQAFGGGRLNRRTTSVSHIGDGLPVASIPNDPTVVENEMAYVVGASILVTREFITSTGLMEDDYFLYFEEIDWALRGGDKFKLAYAPKSIIYHKVGGSSSQIVSDFSLNLLYRNRLRFVSRFIPERLAATRRSLVFELIRHVFKSRWRDARLLYRVLLESRSIVQSSTHSGR